MGKAKITNHAWTDEEIAVLTKLWTAGASISEISQVLTSRTGDAIMNKAGRIGLQRPTPTIDKDLLEKYSKIYEC